MCTMSRKFLALIGLLHILSLRDSGEPLYFPPWDQKGWIQGGALDPGLIQGPTTERKTSVGPRLFHEKECYVAGELLHQLVGWVPFFFLWMTIAYLWILFLVSPRTFQKQLYFFVSRTFCECRMPVSLESGDDFSSGDIQTCLIKAEDRLFFLRFYINSIYRCCLQHFVAVFVESCVSVAYVSLGNLQTGRQQLYLLTETSGGSRLGPYPHSLRYPQSCWRWWSLTVSL